VLIRGCVFEPPPQNLHATCSTPLRPNPARNPAPSHRTRDTRQAAESSGKGRDALLKLDAQAQLQKGYEYEEHPGVCAAMEAAARAFMFGAQEEGEGEGEGVEQAATVVTEVA